MGHTRCYRKWVLKKEKTTKNKNMFNVFNNKVVIVSWKYMKNPWFCLGFFYILTEHSDIYVWKWFHFDIIDGFFFKICTIKGTHFVEMSVIELLNRVWVKNNRGYVFGQDWWMAVIEVDTIEGFYCIIKLNKCIS